MIAGMARGGVPPEDLAADYGLSLHHVQQALDYTESIDSRRRRR
ncbi:uncharacterized protein (DUF433 family) [Mycobacterium sp. URHB0021]|jgi:uncharacterized protein (DUF433 family)